MDYPDLIVIVLDCARAGSVEPLLGAAAPDSALGRFYREATRFPVAVASSPWTVPSHASLFTGLQPWEHGCHNHGGEVLDRRPPTVAERLGAFGYRSVAVSENPLVSPITGLTRGFSRRAWGSTARWVTRTDVGAAPHAAEGVDAGPTRPSRNYGLAARAALFGMHRLPLLPAISAAVTGEVPSPDGHQMGRAGRWVNQEVERALAPSAGRPPLFLFVNLLDPHEPYLHPGRNSHGLGRQLSALTVPQDQHRYLVRPKLTENGQVAALLPGYRRAVERSVTRVGELLEAVQRGGRWEQSLIVVTSDHGQAFGEHANLFHGLFVHEENLRIPLLVKLPGPEPHGGVAAGQTGLIDFAATVRDLIGAEAEWGGEGESWRAVSRGPRSRPLRAIGDGLRGGRALRFFLGPERFAQLDQEFGVAYADHVKVVVGRDGVVHHAGVGETLEETPGIGAPPSELVAAARDALDRLQAAVPRTAVAS